MLQLPYYVTRKSADGMIGVYSMNGYLLLVCMLLVWLNVFAWGIIGLVEAVRFYL